MQEHNPVRSLLADALSGRYDRRTLLRRAAALGISAPMFGMLLAACGSSEATETPAASGSGSQPSATSASGSGSGSGQATGTAGGQATSAATKAATKTATQAASGGGVIPENLVIMQGVDANTLDPLLRNSTPEFNINLHIFDMFTTRNPKTLEIEPGIAQSWKAVDDTTWEIKLAENAKFHNGDPVNADAAIFSFERAAKPKVGDKPIVQSLATLIAYASSEKVDEHTIRVKTKKPAAILPDLLASFEIVPPSVYNADTPDGLAKLSTKPVGSGPYKFVEWVKDDHIKLEANPDYWGKKPTSKTVLFRPVPELSARVVALQNGEANIIVNVAPDLVQQVNQSDKARVSQVTGGRIIFLGIRADKKPFDDKRARQALNYAIDFDGIKKALLNGAGERAAVIVNPPHVNKNIKAYPFDPEKAKALLKEAGVPAGFEVTMDAPNGRYIKDAEMAQAIAQTFETIGLKINLKVLDWSVYAGQLIPSRELDPLYFLGLGAPFTGEQELYYVHPDYSLNFTRWQNDDFVAKFKELNQSVDATKRQQLMDELQQIVYDECPWVPIWHQVDFYGATKNMKWDARADERISALDIGI